MKTERKNITEKLMSALNQDSIEDRYKALEKLGLPDYIIQSTEVALPPEKAFEDLMEVINDNSPELLTKLDKITD